MLQAIMVKPGKIIFKEIEKPKPKKNEVLVKVERIGICGSDIHVFKGLHPYTDYPIVQGHEASGVIEEVGSQVKESSMGDKIILLPQVTCGKCYPCRNGMYHICNDLKVMGFQTNGIAQEYIALSEEMVLKISEDLTYDEGAMMEPTAVAIHAISRAGNISNKKVLVLGAGPIGNLVSQVAKGLGASKVMITDRSDFRLNIAKDCNIDFTINPEREDLHKAIIENFGEDGVDIIFECVGIQDTISQAISVARKGSKIIVVGVYGKKPIVDLGLVQDRELSLIGTLMYQKNDFLSAIKLTENGRLQLKKLITDEFPFSKFLEAYDYILEKNDKVMKVMIHFN